MKAWQIRTIKVRSLWFDTDSIYYFLCTGRKQDPARSHVLYGVLDYIATTVAAQDAKLNKLEQQVATCQALQNELKGLMLEITKSSFSLKEKGYEVW